MNVSESDVKPWPAYRVKRFLKILDYKSKGLTDKQVSQQPDMPSESTVNRELNSPQALEMGTRMVERATGMIWPLIEKQIYQIEHDVLKPGQKLNFRGNLISTLMRLVPQKIEQKIDGSVQHYDVEALLDNALEQEKLREKDRKP